MVDSTNVRSFLTLIHQIESADSLQQGTETELQLPRCWAAALVMEVTKAFAAGVEIAEVQALNRAASATSQYQKRKCMRHL
jgi:hypothetical protein